MPHETAAVLVQVDPAKQRRMHGVQRRARVIKQVHRPGARNHVGRIAVAIRIIAPPRLAITGFPGGHLAIQRGLRRDADHRGARRRRRKDSRRIGPHRRAIKDHLVKPRKEPFFAQTVKEIMHMTIAIPGPVMRHEAQHRPAARGDEIVTPRHPVFCIPIYVIQIFKGHDQGFAALDKQRRMLIPQGFIKSLFGADLLQIGLPLCLRLPCRVLHAHAASASFWRTSSYISKSGPKAASILRRSVAVMPWISSALLDL